MPLIKILMPATRWPLARQTPHGSACWGDYTFAINNDVDECDACVVLDALPGVERCICPPERVFYLGLEPPIQTSFHERFLAQFATVVTCGGHHIAHPRHIESFPLQPWYFGIDMSSSCTLAKQSRYWTFEQVAALQPKKTKLLSVVCSEKRHTPGHRKRYEFTKALKEHFGDRLDWFGTGVNPLADKAQALVDYKYHVAIENSSVPHYWTEKLADPYLGWALPIYWGCPNVTEYFPADSLVGIDLDDLPGAIKTIEHLIEASAWESSLEAIREGRRRVLEQYNLFPMIIRLVEQTAAGPRAKIVLRPHAHFVGRMRYLLRRTRARLQFGWGVTKVFRFLGKI